MRLVVVVVVVVHSRQQTLPSTNIRSPQWTNHNISIRGCIQKFPD
jgi:hypothetical protein